MRIRVPIADSCAFCDYLAGRAECAWVERTAQISSFVNLHQYERGALLVIPNRHAPTVFDLEESEIAAVQNAAVRVGRAAVEAFDATGLNIFQNNGVDAGQTVPHYHVHVVPRYPDGDPQKVFRAVSTPILPFAQRLKIADAVRARLTQGSNARS